MHLAPLFSRKLVFMPLDLGHPVWVQADSVDINFHIRRADLARKGASPMTLAKAHQRCAQLHGELIDRDFPLWEFHVFNRIKMPDGKIVAGFFSKIHHAALDGKGGVMLANAMLDLTPVPRNVTLPGPSRHREREADLTLGKMIGSVFSSSLGQLSKLAKALPSAARALGGTLARQSIAGSAAGLLARASMKLAPLTPFNTGITTGRVFTTATLPLADCKAMGKAIGGSLNDIVLWLCSTALRDYLSQRHSLPKKSLVAAMPVSLREAGAGGATDSSKLGNQVSISLVQLGTHLAHPLKRMNAIMTSTAKVKTSMQSLKGLLPTDYPSLLAPWLVGGAGKLALNVYGKSGMVAHLPRLANLAISNVPGPPVPLYLAGAKLLSFHPLSIILHGLALNITVQTYAGHVEFGIVADKKALPHARELAKAIALAFKQAQALLGSMALTPAEAVASTKKTVRKRSVTAPSVKTRKSAVSDATKASNLEKPPAARQGERADTVATGNNPKTFNAAGHGKLIVQTTSTKTVQQRSTPRHSTSARHST